MVARDWRNGVPSGGGRGVLAPLAAVVAVLVMAAVVGLYLAEMKREIGALTGNLVKSQEQLKSTSAAYEQLKDRTTTTDASIREIHISLASKDEAIDDLRRREEAIRDNLRSRLTGLEENIATNFDTLRATIDTEAEIGAAAIGEIRRIKEEMKGDIGSLYRSILFPSVQIECKGSIGSGTVIYSQTQEKQALTYILTAYHVVEKAVSRDGDKEKRDKVTVKMYDDEGKIAGAVDAEIVSYIEKRDTALLRLETKDPLKHAARLPGRDRLKFLRVFMPIYTVGCPLGHEPLPSAGEISNLNKMVDSERYYMISAPTIFGNSGGGVFLKDSFEMIGISNMICTYDGLFSTPVPHLGVIVPLTDVYDWLDTQHLQYIYDSRFDKDHCDAERERTRKATPELVKATWDK